MGSVITEEGHKYKLRYSEVRLDVLRPPYGTNSSCIEYTL